MWEYLAIFGPGKYQRFTAETNQEARRKAVAFWHIPKDRRHVLSVTAIKKVA